MPRSEVRYLVFVRNVGNLGPSQKPRKQMVGTVTALQRHLPSSVRVVGSFRHTGNFMVESKLSACSVAMAFAKIFGSDCTALPASKVAALLGRVRGRLPPPNQRRARWTSGMAFKLSASAETTVPRAVLKQVDPAVVFGWKNDPTRNGKLDRNDRRGGWGGVAADASAQFGGVWTARSLSTIEGLLAKATLD